MILCSHKRPMRGWTREKPNADRPCECCANESGEAEKIGQRMGQDTYRCAACVEAAPGFKHIARNTSV